MKSDTRFILLCLLFFFISACTDSRLVERVHDFDNATWHRFNILSFDLPVNSTVDEYTMEAIVRHTSHLEQDRIPIHFIMTFPSGEERIWQQTIVIRNRDGIYQGVRKEGIYEVVVPVRTRLAFRETGNCNISVEQIIPKYNTQGILSFGLSLIRN
jgi:gliding motility-associated lipoprotein GldH